MNIQIESKKPIAVLFVHGLAGDPIGTWGSFGALMEKDPLIGRSIDIGYFGFPTHLIAFPTRKKLLRIQDLSRCLATEIEHKYYGYDRLVIISHSMGGLITQHFFSTQIKSNRATNITDILLYGTPNLGSWLSNWLTRLPFLNIQVLQMRESSDIIDVISADWELLECSKKVNVQFVIGGQDRVVSRDSASRYSWAHTQYIADNNHRQMVKPADDKQVSYLIARKIILKDRIQGSDADGLNDANTSGGISNRELRTSDVLFDAYRPKFEPYYIDRNEDRAIIELTKHRSVWIWGPSGYGKTSSIVRSMYQSGKSFRMVALGHLAGSDALGIFRGFCIEISSANNNQIIAADGWPDLLKNIIEELFTLHQKGIERIIIEEIPIIDAGQSAIMIDKVEIILQTIRSDDRFSDFHLAFSSIIDPSEIIPDRARITEIMNFYAVGQWQSVDAFRLIEMIAKTLAIAIDSSLCNDIAANFSYSPRKIKGFFMKFGAMKAMNGKDDRSIMYDLVAKDNLS